MTIREFIKQHRTEIDKAIDEEVYRWDGNGGRGKIPDPPPSHNDEERRLCVLNMESLHLWARSEGVEV